MWASCLVMACRSTVFSTKCCKRALEVGAANMGKRGFWATNMGKRGSLGSQQGRGQAPPLICTNEAWEWRKLGNLQGRGQAPPLPYTNDTWGWRKLCWRLL